MRHDTATSGVPITEVPPFEGGPPHKVETWLGLVRAGHPRFLRRALLAIAVGWCPLALLSALNGDFTRSDAENSFILDFGAHARFLIASPLLILAEAACIPRLAAIVRHFQDAGLIAESDRDRYQQAVTSTRQLINSTLVEVLSIAFAYAIIAALILTQPAVRVPLWHGTVGASGLKISLAGWWGFLVSLPILFVLLLGWLWRICLWTRFLWLTSRMDLRLVPAHPDQVAGLKFVGSSLKGFLPLSFTLGVIAAGPVFNHVFHYDESPLQFKYLIAGVVVFAVALCAGPLLVFARRLLSEERRGTFEYGALSLRLGQQLERKWMTQGPPIDSNSLEAPDFSATTDLNSITANVNSIRIAPLDTKHIALLAAAALLPFLPVALLVIPLDALVKGVAGIFI